MKEEKSKPRLHSGRMELAVVSLLNIRTHTIVPNVSWGLGINHECDLLVLDSQNRYTEIEIKISKSDLVADFKKEHHHSSRIITRLIYAVPDFLVEFALTVIPPDCGLISVKYNEYSRRYFAIWVRVVKHRKQMLPVKEDLRYRLLELGVMRIWELKKRLYDQRDEINAKCVV